MKLKDKIALVTGTSPNIGGGIAEELAAEGADVIAVDAIAENARDCAQDARRAGRRALSLTCDVTDEAQVKAMVDAALAAFGRIDVLVNNAGFYNAKGLLEMPFTQWKAQLAVFLDGAFLVSKYVAKSMVERGVRGSIITVISTAGHQGQPGNIAYSTSKMGLRNFTNSAAMEFASYGIRFNTLTPTATARTESYERAKRWGREIAPSLATPGYFVPLMPMQKLPKPSDYGKAAVFLASDDSAMVTGMDIRVDGGAIAKYWAWDPSKPQS